MITIFQFCHESELQIFASFEQHSISCRALWQYNAKRSTKCIDGNVIFVEILEYMWQTEFFQNFYMYIEYRY